MSNALESNKLHSQGTLNFSDIVDAVSNNFCLPSIQRGVVWSKEDIASFFDSLFKGFPVGNILLWQLTTKEDREITDYYPINTKEDTVELRGSRKIKNFSRETKKRFCVIDGQQRITALYRGLNNNYIVDGKRSLLFFNVLYDGSESSAFRYFSERGKIEEKHLWIPVKEVWDIYDDKKKRDAYLGRYIKTFTENDNYYYPVNRKGEKRRKSNSIVRKVDSIFDYYKENKKLASNNFKALVKTFRKAELPYTIVDLNTISTSDSTIEKLFDVFVRLNKSGRPLNPTDLLFAQIAKSSNIDDLWTLFDNAKNGINNQDNGIGKKSRFSQDNILRFIWLAFRHNNDSFSKYFMTPANHVNIDQKVMDKIKDSFLKAKKVFVEGHFSFDGHTPYSMFLPIAYYFYFGGKRNKKADSEIERYYEVSLVSDAFSQSTDTVMSKIIEALGKNKKNNITLFGKNREFDFSILINTIKENGGTFFDVSAEKVEDILNKNYVNDMNYIKRILTLLSRRNNPNLGNYDLDHMHPKKFADEDNKDLFFEIIGSKDETSEALYQFFKKHVNDFGNLQLLDEAGNRGEKNDKLLVEWLKEYRKPKNLHEYSVSNFVCGDDTPDGEPLLSYFELINFKTFYENRKAVLRKSLKEFFEIND